MASDSVTRDSLRSSAIVTPTSVVPVPVPVSNVAPKKRVTKKSTRTGSKVCFTSNDFDDSVDETFSHYRFASCLTDLAEMVKTFRTQCLFQGYDFTACLSAVKSYALEAQCENMSKLLIHQSDTDMSDSIVLNMAIEAIDDAPRDFDELLVKWQLISFC